MSDQSAADKVGMVWVPDSLANQVKEYASSLMEEQTPDVEGYASIVGGIGTGRMPDISGGSLSRGGLVNALSGTGCAVTLAKNDFMCDDED